MNLTLSIPYSDLTITGRYLESEVQTSDKPVVPECFEIESVEWRRTDALTRTVHFVEMVDHLSPESLTAIERRNLDEIRASIEQAKAEDAA